MYGVSSSIAGVRIASAEEFRFKMADFLPASSVSTVGSVLLGDGATVVLDEASTIGKEEICK